MELERYYKEILKEYANDNDIEPCYIGKTIKMQLVSKILTSYPVNFKCTQEEIGFLISDILHGII